MGVVLVAHKHNNYKVVSLWYVKLGYRRTFGLCSRQPASNKVQFTIHYWVRKEKEKGFNEVLCFVTPRNYWIFRKEGLSAQSNINLTTWSTKIRFSSLLFLPYHINILCPITFLWHYTLIFIKYAGLSSYFFRYHSLIIATHLMTGYVISKLTTHKNQIRIDN